MKNLDLAGEHLIFPETAARLRQWRSDPAVSGVLLVGSKSHEHQDDLSDDDLEVVLNEETYAGLKPTDCIEVFSREEGEEGAQRKLIYDAQFISMQQLRVRINSPLDLDHWPYGRARVLFDREGDLLPMVHLLGTMDPAFRTLRLTHATVDAWVAVYRAQKTARRGEDICPLTGGTSRTCAVSRGLRA